MPKPYLVIKETVLREAMKNGGALKRKTVRELCKVCGSLKADPKPVEDVHIIDAREQIDPSKCVKLFDFFVHSGWIGKA